uniref:Zf-LYAR domain-containing protein n=1 Tax=Gongylonema pulchrum TaxID=637853 RepID=A0A183ENY9_9BILA
LVLASKCFGFCRDATYSCLDCGQKFTLQTYKSHIKCLSENKKYGGSKYVEKENKVIFYVNEMAFTRGEVKQSRWVEQVERAIENVREPSLKKLLEQILGYANIPRKEAKFINFLQNSRNIRDRDICTRAWNCIAEEAKKMQNGTTMEQSNNRSEANNQCDMEVSSNAEEKLRSNAHKEEQNSEEKAEVSFSSSRVVFIVSGQAATSNGVKKFKWKRAIKRKLEEAKDNEMKVKRLRSEVIKCFLETNGDSSNDVDLKAIFSDKLQKLGLQIHDKKVRLK